MVPNVMLVGTTSSLHSTSNHSSGFLVVVVEVEEVEVEGRVATEGKGSSRSAT